MNTHQVWIGVDVGHARSSVCILNAAGSVISESECETTADAVEATIDSIGKDSVAAIAMEPGYGTHLCRKLRCRGYNVVIFETRKLKRLLEIRRNKTDVSDARGIADVARLATDAPSQVHLKTIECQALRTRLQLRQKMLQHRLAAEGFMRSLFHLHGMKISIPRRGLVVRDVVLPELERLWAEEGIDLSDDIEPLLDLIEALRKHLNVLDIWLAEKVQSIAECKRFLEIPGVGPICALSFYSAVEEPCRFRRNADVASYFGLTPRLYQSGAFRRTFGITKMGNKLTRSHLYIAAQNLLRTRSKKSALQDWGLSLADRVGRGRARVAVARKLSVLMLSMWKNNTCFDPCRQGSCKF